VGVGEYDGGQIMLPSVVMTSVGSGVFKGCGSRLSTVVIEGLRWAVAMVRDMVTQSEGDG
jgi:hypothetical protein